MDDGGDTMRISAFVSLTLLLLPIAASADGMTFTVIGADMDVRATEQRAVMWLRNGTWEIHIQPLFPRDAGGAAWVVPFPVQPTVEPGNADFFDQLELITSPIFVKVCSEDSGGLFCFGCFGAKGDEAGLGEGDTTGTIRVIVWEQGKVGDLDYVILSAFGGDNLVEWLNTQGYQLPPGAQEVIAGYETLGVYFFVARLSQDADPQKPLAPVRFVLPGMDPPAYPLQLTALGVPDGQDLDLTLWLVYPKDHRFAPNSHPVRKLGSVPRDVEEFDEALEKVFTDHSPDTLASLYGKIIYGSGVMFGNFCDNYPCVTFEELGIELPYSWSEEFREIHNREYWLHRYQARLTASAMAKDLVLQESTDQELEWINNMYVEYTCKENVAAMTWLLVMGMGLGLLRRIRRA